MTIREKKLDLLNQRRELLDAAKALAVEGKHEGEEYKAKLAELDKLKGQLQALEDLEGQEDAETPDPVEKGMKGVAAQAAQTAGKAKADAVKAFAEAARAGFKVKAVGNMNETTPADGGYTVPVDIVTRVEEYRGSKASLRDLVSVENVTAPSGHRTFKKRSQQTGFVKVGEGGKIPKKAGPQFEVKEYTISKYAGFFAVTQELLDDSDENITSTLVKWIGDEARVTDNILILAAVNKKNKVALDGLDGLRKAALVDLDSAFRATTKIVTNTNGVYWLSTLKDANGRDLLTPVPSEAGKLQLAIGPVVIPVEEFPNADLPNDGTKVPFIVGDLKEGVRLFDRKLLTLTSSGVAVAGDVNSYEQDMVLTRAIERLDVQQWDDQAYINGYIDTAAAPAVEG